MLQELVPVAEGLGTMNTDHSEAGLEVAGNKSSAWGKELAAYNGVHIGSRVGAAWVSMMTPYCSTGDVHLGASAHMTPGKDPAFREHGLSTSRSFGLPGFL